MGDVGIGADATLSPNAAAIGVDPSLDSLAAFIVQGQAAWATHDGATLNSLLQQFWTAEGALDPSTLQGQSAGSLVGGTLQDDVTALDAYSHRLLGYEYMWQMSQQEATPTTIPGILALEVPEFQKSSAEFAQVGLTMQSNNDALILSQANGWAAQSAASWIDDSFTAAVAQVVNNDLQAAGNLVSNVGSALSFLTSTPVIIGLGILAVVILVGAVRK